MSIFDNVNALPADRILAVVGLVKAKDGRSWVCPQCDNGSKGTRHGGKGDGIRPTMYHGRQIWHCYGCDAHMTNADLVAAVENIADASELARRLEDLFPEYVESHSSFAEKTKCPPPEPRKVDVGEPPPPPKDYEAKFYPNCRARLSEFLNKNGGKYRGLDKRTLVEAGVGFADNFMDAQFLIVPYGRNSFFARKISGSDTAPEKYHTRGVERKMYVAAPLKAGVVGTVDKVGGGKSEVRPINFVTEGELDALTIKQAFEAYDSGVVALGGAGRIRAFFDELGTMYGTAAEKPLLLFAADSDERGIKAADEFCGTGRALGYPCEKFFFAAPSDVGKVDANSYLQEHGDAALLEFLWDRIEAKEPSLNAQAKAFRKSATAAPESDSANRDTCHDLKPENELPDGIEPNAGSDSPAPMTPPDVEEPLPEPESLPSLTGELNAAEPVEVRKNSVAERLGIRYYTAAEYFGKPFDDDFARLEKYSGRESGFELLDEKQCWLPGLYTVGASPGAGKTSLIWQLLNQFADKGEPCVFCSYELSSAELFAKSITRELRRQKLAGSDVALLTTADIRLGGRRNDSVAVLREKFQRSSVWARRFKFFDLGGDKLVKLNDLITLLDEEAKAMSRPPTIAVDYLQLIPVENSKASPKERVDEIMLRLKAFQKKFDAMLFLISSLSRAGYQSAKNKGGAQDDDDLSIFKESGMIEFSSDVIWKLTTINKPSAVDAPRTVALTCSKNRHGATYRIGFEYFSGSDYFRCCDLKPQLEVVKPKSSTKAETEHAR